MKPEDGKPVRRGQRKANQDLRERRREGRTTVHHTNVAFAGTRRGMTEAQKSTLEALLTVFRPTFFHHGMADGSDTEAEEIARTAAPGVFVIGYPAEGHVSKSNPDKVYPAKDPVERDKDIAYSGDLLIATPYGYAEQRRSGTWTTVRWARKYHATILIILPDGKLRGERNDVGS